MQNLGCAKVVVLVSTIWSAEKDLERLYNSGVEGADLSPFLRKASGSC